MNWTDEELERQARKWGEEKASLPPAFEERVLAALGTEDERLRGRDGARRSPWGAAEDTSRRGVGGIGGIGNWWRAAAAAVILVGMGAAGFAVKSNTQAAPGETQGALIAAEGLDEVRAAERQYASAIARLEANAGPILARAGDPTTPPREAALLTGYRNRLRSVDRAIENLRFHLETNPYHAKTRAALLKTYGEKSELLNAILTMRRGA
jgi:hypothetical protein